MYIFLEDGIVLSNRNIVLIIDYIHLKAEENNRFLQRELEKKELINLAPKREKSAVITDDKIYFTSYGTQTLMSRGQEFFNIVGGM